MKQAALNLDLHCKKTRKRGLVQTRLRLKQARALIRLLLRFSAQPERVGFGFAFGEHRARFAGSMTLRF